ncbi:MAG: DinB family protein [Sphingomonadales bacterium]|nr:DinB family protein [Sphingomonadales bacterium]
MTNWTSVIDKITGEVLREFGALTKEELNWKPNSDTWSIAQNLDHLIVVNESYNPVFKSLNDETYKIPLLARMGWIVSFFGKMILNSVRADRKRKMKTFPIWEPSASEIGVDIMKRFELHQDQLKRKIEQLVNFVERDVVISSPASKIIVYKLETAFHIIVEHERRHLEQAREVLRILAAKSK